MTTNGRRLREYEQYLNDKWGNGKRVERQVSWPIEVWIRIVVDAACWCSMIVIAGEMLARTHFGNPPGRALVIGLVGALLVSFFSRFGATHSQVAVGRFVATVGAFAALITLYE